MCGYIVVLRLLDFEEADLHFLDSFPPLHFLLNFKKDDS